MCGIAGIWQLDKTDISVETVRRFNDSMIHRGPDGDGVEIFPSVGLGLAHRRLSILDTSSAGAQPMSDAQSRYCISYNGEVYNFIEIRKELKSLGHSFLSDTDTEVILQAYAQWGADCFHRFNGMWAIALFDRQTEELLLCRDRFGIKPLYYSKTDTQFAFASETNAFKNLTGFDRQINQVNAQIGLADTHALEGAGHTLFQDLYQILPGHFVRMRRGEEAQQKRWYDIREHIKPIDTPYAEQVSHYRHLLSESCRLRMRSDVSLATALSGGVDSTAVYSMVHHLMADSTAERVPEDWQQAFVMTFPGTSIDEREWAEKAISHSGGKATYLTPHHSSLVDDVMTSTQRFDAISTTPILALMGAYRGMRENGVTVSLDGHGVDEMLYGYKNLVYSAYEYYSWHGSREQAQSMADVLTSLFPNELRAQKALTYRAEIDAAQKKRGGLLGNLKSMVRQFRPASSPIRPNELLPILSDKPYDFSDQNDLERPVFIDFFQRTLPSLLRNFDKASMMSSIEIRMPFMDPRMVEMAFSLPMESKLGGGYTKRILRDAMEGIMPEDIRIRTYKVGLGAPTGKWMENELSELVGDTIASADFAQSIYFDGKDVQKTWSAVSGPADPQNIEVWKHLNLHWIAR